jgi:hypothetical protein
MKEKEDKKDSDEKSLGKTFKVRVHKSSDPDINAMYPTQEGKILYTKLRESLINNLEANLETE